MTTYLQLRSLVTQAGEVELSLHPVPIPALAGEEVLVRIEATPINPSDLGLLIGPADPATARAANGITTATIPPAAMPFMAGRLGQSMPVGNEGAGTVTHAGAAPAAQALLGKTAP